MIICSISRVTLVKLTYLLGLACCICVRGQSFRTQNVFHFAYRVKCVWYNIGRLVRVTHDRNTRI